MPHTIKCPNCKAPIHLKQNQTSAVCEYCGHQARQTVMAQPTPPQPKPPQQHEAQRRQIRSQIQQQQKKIKKTILIVVLTATLFPLLLSVCIPAIICNVQKGALVKSSLRQLGVSSLDSSPDQKLALAIGANVRCINDFSDAASTSQQRYFGWVDRKAGPNCRSSCASYGIHQAYYTVAACQKALREAGDASPPLIRHGQQLVAAATQLKTLTAQAYKYYNQKDYLDDNCAEGKRLHRPLVEAFDAYNKAERAIRDVVEQKLPPLIKRRQANARQQDDPMGQMMASYYQVWLDTRELVNACDQVAGNPRRTANDVTVIRTLIKKVDRAAAATVAAEKRVQPRSNNWIQYFLFPFTYESHLNDYVERLVKAAKEHVRCVEGKQKCDNFTRTLNSIYDAYNGYVGYAKGLGPKLHKIETSTYDHCRR